MNTTDTNTCRLAKKSSRFRLAAWSGVVLMALMTPSAAFAHGGDGHDGHDGQDGQTTAARLTGRQRQAIQSATKRFRNPDAARAAGFIPTDVCVELPGVGGMGYHWVNPANIADGVIDPTKPEILVFVPAREGRVKLGAVEYFAADADQNLSTDGDRPNLFGNAFNGPMPGHEPGMPIHFDLHVWLYKHNPAGELAVWNPNVSCSGPSSELSDGFGDD